MALSVTEVKLLFVNGGRFFYQRSTKLQVFVHELVDVFNIFLVKVSKLMVEVSHGDFKFGPSLLVGLEYGQAQLDALEIFQRRKVIRILPILTNLVDEEISYNSGPFVGYWQVLFHNIASVIFRRAVSE